MKISSASKKVLASALSAAMVVAFAPTVAFGTPNGSVVVHYTMNGTFNAVGSDGSVTDAAATAVAHNTGALAGYNTTSGHDYIILDQDATSYKNADGYSFKEFAYDKNANGIIDTDESVTSSVVTQSGQPNLLVLDVTTAVDTAATSIDLIAQYAVPTVKADLENSTVAQYANGTSLKANIKDYGAGLPGHAYTLTFSSPDGALYTQALNASGLSAIQSAEIAFDAAATESGYSLTGTTATVTAPKSAWKTGKYSITLKDVTADKVMSAAEFEIVNVTIKASGNSEKPGTFYNGGTTTLDASFDTE